MTSVTVACVAGRHDQFVEQAVASILDQEQAPDEVIVFLNGRSEATSTTIHKLLGARLEFEAKRLVLSSEEILVTSEAVRQIAEACSSEYLVLVDDDDALDRRFLTHVRRGLNRFDRPDVLVTSHVEFGLTVERSTSHVLGVRPPIGASPWAWINRLGASGTAQFSTGGTVLPVRKLKALRAFDLPKPIVQVDGLCSLRLGRSGFRAVGIPRALYLRRIHTQYPATKDQLSAYGMGVLRGTAIVESSGRFERTIAELFGLRDQLHFRDTLAYEAGLKRVDPLLEVRSSRLRKAAVLVLVTALFVARRLSRLLSLRWRTGCSL